MSVTGVKPEPVVEITGGTEVAPCAPVGNQRQLTTPDTGEDAPVARHDEKAGR
jgi:hypothetical protein